MTIIKELKEKVENILPKNADVTKIEMEGPEIAIYTRNPQAFFENEALVSKTAYELKKRINVRTDKTLLQEPEKVRDKIMEIVPKDADIKDISFNPYFSEVVIESIKPGLVIGKEGMTSKKIILETGWTPKIIRAPTTPSEILRGIRSHLNRHGKERKEILKKVAEDIYREIPENANEWVRLVALGGFQEVGRSCMLIETPETKILFDCGINVATYQDPYPYLDALHFPMDEIDAVVVTHAHVDHSGFVPYLFKSGYRGPVYSTEPTRDLMTLLQFDYIDVAVKEGKEPPYLERDVKEMLKYCIPRDYREVTDIAPDMKLTLHNAAHILGSASVHLHIGEGAHNLVYTGDIKYGFVRLFNNIDLNYPRIETVIIESTYGGKTDILPSRQKAEDDLLRILNETTEAGGNVLIPVFAVGRGQEISLVIENFYNRKLFQGKCYIDGMTAEASAIHTAYPEYLRDHIRRRILQNNSPFSSDVFQVVKNEQRDKILEEKGNVIMASSGMLTGGPSLEYFKKMAEDERNTLVFVGYQGEGSLGRKLQKGMESMPIIENGKTRSLKINMRIETVEGFSVPYETKVFIKRNERYELVEIGKIGEEFLEEKEQGIVELQGISAASFDANGKISMKPVQYLIKHKTSANHLKIYTRTGRSVQVSEGHSLFTLKEGEIRSVKSCELSEGDYIIIPTRLPESNTLTKVEFKDFITDCNYYLQEELLKPKKGGNGKSFIKSVCQDMQALAKFLGYYVAEGSLDKSKRYRAYLSFGSHEKALIDDAIKCIEKAFGIIPTLHKPHKTEVQIRIANKILVNFLEEIGVGDNAKRKRVPNIVFNFSKENQLEFLKAYFAGDGYFYKNNPKGKGYLAAKTTSKQLASDLSYLLMQHGIVTRLKGPFLEKARVLNGHYLKESVIYKLYISEKEFNAVKQKGYLPFALPIKEIKLEKLKELIKDSKTKNLIHAYIINCNKGKRKLIGKEILQKMLTYLDREKLTEKEIKIVKTIEQLVQGDITVDVIVKIEKVEKPEFEYDLCVPETENFCGGFGAIMLHNSGHSDKNQLMNYIKRLKPKPKQIIVNHGNRVKCIGFSQFIQNKLRIKSMCPQNLDALRLK